MSFYVRIGILSVVAFTLGCTLGSITRVDELSRASVSKVRIKSSAEILSDARARVFKVIIKTPTGEGGGTAFILSGPKGKNVIVTNRHICQRFERASDYAVMSIQQGDVLYYTKILRQSDKTDLCLLEIPKELETRVDSYKVADRRPKANESVYSAGHPFLLPLTQVYGEFKNELVLPASPDDEMGGMLAGGLRFGVVPGCSGSPVLNQAGEVVGVVFAYMENGGLMIPLSSLKEFLGGA